MEDGPIDKETPESVTDCCAASAEGARKLRREAICFSGSSFPRSLALPKETEKSVLQLGRDLLLAEIPQKRGGRLIGAHKVIAYPTAREVGLEGLDGLLIQRFFQIVGKQICDLLTADHAVPQSRLPTFPGAPGEPGAAVS